MNLTFPTQAEAQKRAEEIHADLLDPTHIGYNSLYAESCALYVSSGGKAGTARWAIPYQELDKDGKPVDALWKVTIDERPRKVLTEVEVATVAEWTKAIL